MDPMMYTIGWGVENKEITFFDPIKQLPVKDQYHKTYWDHDKTRLHMYTNGFFASHTDKKLGVNFEDLEGLSIRQQREIIKQCSQNRNTKMRNKYEHNAKVNKISLRHNLEGLELYQKPSLYSSTGLSYQSKNT